ncbi:hypothetical protein L226DRAFT_525966 [Lentinus tigrinus ALCF2SS1-7]|uniref:Uncharacterized protein n=1 Tax=Lentinus tigrinus ALCF2SS1-6 TaxID=1328759 RepID=A0A5C2RW06_9APHY|nr:hypothetical protein L227DRAFT_615901 [Lentinus tigrinus ALCF2SS1-6]RPD70487.1 hypothetical protein L226DRAFT_525966 [Lentinus tigrinus ALCF2SS1-7]
MNFETAIYLQKDAGIESVPGMPVSDLLLLVDGPTAVHSYPMILPTDTPSRIHVGRIAGWIGSLSGAFLELCDITPKQRELLLALVCGYRAFIELPQGVRAADFYEFANRLVDVSDNVAPLKDAYPRLREVADWLEGILPPTCFSLLADRTSERTTVQESAQKQCNLMVTLAALLDPELHRAVAPEPTIPAATSTPTHTMDEHAAAHPTTSVTKVPPPPAPSPTSAKPVRSKRALKRARQAARRHAQRAKVYGSEPEICHTDTSSDVTNTITNSASSIPETHMEVLHSVHDPTDPSTPVPAALIAQLVGTDFVMIDTPSQPTSKSDHMARLSSDSSSPPAVQSHPHAGTRHAVTVEDVTDSEDDRSRSHLSTSGARAATLLVPRGGPMHPAQSPLAHIGTGSSGHDVVTADVDYNTDSSTPSLETVSNSSDSADKEYISDDDVYYDDV